MSLAWTLSGQDRVRGYAKRQWQRPLSPFTTGIKLNFGDTRSQTARQIPSGLHVAQPPRRHPFVLPDIKDHTYSQREAEDVFQRCFDNDSVRLSPYFVAEAVEAEERSQVSLPTEPLQTSPRLELTRDELPGIHTPYVYISSGCSFGCLHKEDFDLLSANVLYAGYPKIWTFIPAREGRFLESRLANESGLQYTCDQFLRHENLVVSPARLRAWGITFHVEVQNPGDLIVTDYGVYHQVFNTGPNIAEAINGCEDSWVAPITYLECKESCNGEPPVSRVSLFIVESDEVTTSISAAHKLEGAKPRYRALKRENTQDYRKRKRRRICKQTEGKTSDTDIGSDDIADTNDVSSHELPESLSEEADQLAELDDEPFSIADSTHTTTTAAYNTRYISEVSKLNPTTDNLNSLVDEAISLGFPFFADSKRVFDRYRPHCTSDAWLCDEAVMKTLEILIAGSQNPDSYLVPDSQDFRKSPEQWAWPHKVLQGSYQKILIPRHQEVHWDLVHIDLEKHFIEFYDNPDQGWAKKLAQILKFPSVDDCMKIRDPEVKSTNGIDCGFALFAQADILLNPELQGTIPQDSTSLRMRYLFVMLKWLRMKACLEEPAAALGVQELHTARTSTTFVSHYEQCIESTFACPQIFAELCNIRHVQRGVVAASPMSMVLQLSSTSQVKKTEGTWYEALCSRYILGIFTEKVTEAKKRISLARNERKRRRGEGGGSSQPPRARTVAKDAIVLECMNLTDLPEQHLRNWLDMRIKKGEMLEKILDAAGFGLYEPFWMLMPSDQLEKLAHSSETLLTSLLQTRPLLMAKYTEICAGLRVVLGLDHGELRMDSMTPSQLLREELDSEVLLSSLKRLS